MAQMPTTPSKTNPTAPVPPVANPAPADTEAARTKNLSFDDVAEIPGAAARAALVNPFQEIVNRLAKTGGASSTVVDAGEDAKWARDMIRRAAGAINKGAVTKMAPATRNADGTGEKIPGKVRVYFTVGDKRPRKS